MEYTTTIAVFSEPLIGRRMTFRPLASRNRSTPRSAGVGSALAGWSWRPGPDRRRVRPGPAAPRRADERPDTGRGEGDGRQGGRGELDLREDHGTKHSFPEGHDSGRGRPGRDRLAGRELRRGPEGQVHQFDGDGLRGLGGERRGQEARGGRDPAADQSRPELIAAPREPALDRADRAAELRRGLLVRLALEVAEDHRARYRAGSRSSSSSIVERSSCASSRSARDRSDRSTTSPSAPVRSRVRAVGR